MPQNASIVSYISFWLKSFWKNFRLKNHLHIHQISSFFKIFKGDYAPSTPTPLPCAQLNFYHFYIRI